MVKLCDVAPEIEIKNGFVYSSMRASILSPALRTLPDLSANASNAPLMKWTLPTLERWLPSGSIYRLTVGRKPSGSATSLSAASFAMRNLSANGILPRFFQFETTLGAMDSASATLLGPPNVLMMSIAMPSIITDCDKHCNP